MKPKNILLIEDDRDMVEDVPHLMSQPPYGMHVDSVLVTPGMDVSALVDKLTSNPYDCLVLDIRMPPLTGMTNEDTEGGRLTGVLLCKEIRKHLPKTPILVFTAVSDPDAHTAIQQAGADRILAKPAYPDELAESIKRLVAAR